MFFRRNFSAQVCQCTVRDTQYDRLSQQQLSFLFCLCRRNSRQPTVCVCWNVALIKRTLTLRLTRTLQLFHKHKLFHTVDTQTLLTTLGLLRQRRKP